MSLGRMLGAVMPDTQRRMENVLATLEALHQQVYSDVTAIGRAGRDVTGLQDRVNALGERMVALDATISTITDDYAAQWFTDAAAVEAEYRALLNETTLAVRDVTEGRELLGFTWGTGVLAAVGAAAWFVWKKRRKGRR